MKKIVLVFLSVFLFCSSLFAEMWMLKEPGLPDYMNTWMGQNADILIKTWGPANGDSRLSDDTRVMKYEKEIIDIKNPVYIKGSVRTDTYKDKYGKYYTISRDSTYYDPGSTNIYKAVAMFTVDSNNEIIDWSYEGNQRALEEMIKPATSPFFDLNDFYVSQYYKRAQEWIGYTLDDVKRVYAHKYVKGKTLERVESEELGVYWACASDNDLGTAVFFIFDEAEERVERILIGGKYELLEKLYESPYDVSVADINIKYLFGVSYGVDNAIGIHVEERMDMFSNWKVGISLDSVFGKNIVDFNLKLITFDYYFIDEDLLKMYAGLGFDFGYNFGSLNKGFNLGFPVNLGIQLGPVDIRGFARPGFFTDKKFFWRVQVSYVLDPTNYLLRHKFD